MSTMRHNPTTDRAGAGGSPMVNKILTTVYNPAVAVSFTEPTFFMLRRGLSKVAVSIYPVDNAGVQKSGTGFSVGLHRSIDNGNTYQLLQTFTNATETDIEVSEAFLYQFRLATKGADDVRVRAKPWN